MKRRDFLAQTATGALLFAGCQRPLPPTRKAVLIGLVQEIVKPDIQAVVRSSDALSAAAVALGTTPSLEGLRSARSAWFDALLAWKQAQCFRHGPMVETNAFVRTLFWPIRPAAIESVLEGSSGIDEVSVANLGVDARGVYAMEYLLYPLEKDENAALSLFAGDAGKRRRELCQSLAASIAKYASNAGHLLGDGGTYAARFAQGEQISLSILVNQMIGTVENLSAHRLGHVLNLEKSHLLKPQEVEGWPSGTSHRIALAQLTGNERLYRGGKSGGLAALTRAVAPAIDESLSRRYAEALRTVRELAEPLERVVTTNPARLAAAAAATKALELAIKVDLASALGITITFQTGDGD
jgi:predicted lipoprotein